MARDSALVIHKMPHVQLLDGIRAFSIAVVFFSHAGFGAMPAGFGVTTFFFLSGFLITSLLRLEAARTGRVSIPKFYLRRTLRIMPPLYITMVFSAVVVALGLITTRIDVLGVLAQVFFFANYTYVYDVPGLPGLPLWSLAVEEHFYLFFPLLVGLMLSRGRPRRLAMWCAAACLVFLGIRVISVYGFGVFTPNHYMSHTRLDSILFGCILALWQNPTLEGDRAWRPKLWHAGVAAVAILGTFVAKNEVFRDTLMFTIQGAALFVLFSWTLQSGGLVRRVLMSPPLQVIGLYSYTIYLVHLVFIEILKQNAAGMHLVLRGVIAAVLALLYAALMYRFVERPLGAMRRKLNRDEPSAPPPNEEMAMALEKAVAGNGLSPTA